MKAFFLIFFTAPFFLFSQQSEKFPVAGEISIDETGIYAVSGNLYDTLMVDAESNTVFYCYPDSTVSFWYKIYAKAGCNITFEINPSTKNNIYNFFLYKKEGDITVSEILTTNIAPIRANLCKDEIAYSGTGLSSFSSTVLYCDTSLSVDGGNGLYHTPYHAAVKAKAGDVFMLNVYHTKGMDCGFSMKINSQISSRIIKALCVGCYAGQFVKLNAVHSVSIDSQKKMSEINIPVRHSTDLHILQTTAATNANISSNSLTIGEEHGGTFIKTPFIIRDSIRHIPIEAEISVVKKQKAGNPSVLVKEKGKYEIVLEKNTAYHITFSAVGYKTKDVFFMTDDNTGFSANEVCLVPCKAGDNFVMDKIYFYPNTCTLKPGVQAEVNKLASYLIANPGIYIEIQGHTNGNHRIKTSMGSGFKGSSKKLSQLRADKIKKQLIEKGISAERLISKGYGGSKMIYKKPENQIQADKNIRVEILIRHLTDAAALTSKD